MGSTARRLLRVLRRRIGFGCVLLSTLLTSCTLDPGGFGIGGPPCPPADPWVVDSEEVWGPSEGPILVERNVVIEPGGVLRVLPGTEVVFVDRTVCVWTPAGRVWMEPTIEVRGQLLCTGTADSIVAFTGGDEFFGRRIEIDASEAVAGDCVFEWADLGWVEWSDGNPTLRSCVVSHLTLTRSGEILIEDCTLGRVHVSAGGTGVISGSTFTEPMSLYDDRLEIRGNSFRDVYSDYWGAIRCNTDSRPLITENVFENCGIAIGIYSGTPEIHYNNFDGNEYNIAVIAEPEPVETDTVDARDNWWGTTDSWEIVWSIHYVKRDDHYSRKTVLYWPFALGPFPLDGIPAAGETSSRR